MATEDPALMERYHNDPIFHALVHIMSEGGYADDDGVHHAGPTLADAERVQKFYDAFASIGLSLVDRSNAADAIEAEQGQ